MEVNFTEEMLDDLKSIKALDIEEIEKQVVREIEKRRIDKIIEKRNNILKDIKDE